MRFVKKNASLLQKLAIYMLMVRVVDVFWIVEPAFRQREFYIHWLDVACLLASGDFGWPLSCGGAGACRYSPCTIPGSVTILWKTEAESTA